MTVLADNHAEALGASTREWIGLAVLSLPCMLYTMDLTILNLAIPVIARELMPTASQLLWIVDIYGFMVAGALLVMGTLGDRIGRRRLLMIGATSFGLVSILAAFASNAPMLIAARAALGVAGATLAPSTLSLISSMFRLDRQRTFAVSIWIASFSFGAALGPVIGGALLAVFPWRTLFVVPVPIMLLLLAAGPRLLPEYKTPGAGRLDFASAMLSVATVLPVIFGVKVLAEGGAPILALGSAAAGFACGAIFVRRQLTLPDPLLDMRLLRQFAIGAALGLNVLDFFLIFGIVLLTTQYMQLVLGLSPLQAGLWSLPDGLGFVAGSLLTSSLLKLMRPAYALALGLSLGAIGLFIMTRVGGPASLYVLVTGITLFSIGLAPCAAIIADLVVSASPPERAGAASALNETSSEFGGATGIALLGSLASYLYRSRLGQTLPPGLDTETSAIALRGIGAAVEVAGTSSAGGALLATAQSAYVEAMQTSLLCAVAIAAIAALCAVTIFRRPRP
jgi:DHA2 family multidrug resistance protein-like MFS transporter